MNSKTTDRQRQKDKQKETERQREQVQKQGSWGGLKACGERNQCHFSFAFYQVVFNFYLVKSQGRAIVVNAELVIFVTIALNYD